MGWKGKGGVDFNKRTLTMQTSAIPNNNIKLNKIAKKYGGKLIVFNGKKVKGGEVKSFEIESINERSDFRAMKDFMTLASKRKVDYISRYDDSQLQVDIGKKSFLIQVQSLKESVNESNPKIDKIKDIVKKKQYKRIGGVIVDMQTANAILKVHKALNAANRKKYERLPVSKMADIAWKLVK
jgi:hypothetical protein